MVNQWEIKVLVDGACPLCVREAKLWRRLDRGRGRVLVEDIAAPGFDPTEYNLTRRQVSDQIHALLPSGRTLQGMEVFRRVYEALGWGWLLAPTAWPVLRPLFDRAYGWFARHRRKIARRVKACDQACWGPGQDHGRVSGETLIAGRQRE